MVGSALASTTGKEDRGVGDRLIHSDIADSAVESEYVGQWESDVHLCLVSRQSTNDFGFRPSIDVQRTGGVRGGEKEGKYSL